MKKSTIISGAIFLIIGLITSCSKNEVVPTTSVIDIVNESALRTPPVIRVTIDPYAAIKFTFGNNIDPTALLNYANQAKPTYITKDNARTNPITNAKATLGRVLFYDKNLSVNNTISCSSCHKQNFAFSDTALISSGVLGGLSVRHSMRLINTRFSNETKFFWNERAVTLEQQTTMPIQDHLELGYSGINGRESISGLLSKLSKINYYKELFKFVYNDTIVTETRLQESLAQFIRSIQSFDSKYDIGRVQVNNANDVFPNFTTIENTGKQLFMTPPVFNTAGIRTTGGLGCNSCHNAPEFDIDPNSRNNGIIGVIGSNNIELNDTRSPSLRDITKADGSINSRMMHNGAFNNLNGVLAHYNNIPINQRNTNLDPRLRQNNNAQQLNLTVAETNAVITFMRTLAGTAVYTDKKWASPFILP
jgi:cytochrome c peroxidase